MKTSIERFFLAASVLMLGFNAQAESADSSSSVARSIDFESTEAREIRDWNLLGNSLIRFDSDERASSVFDKPEFDPDQFEISLPLSIAQTSETSDSPTPQLSAEEQAE